MSNEFKFKKGDKILGKNYEDLGMYAGKTYTVKTCTEGQMTLEECFCKETGRNYTFSPSMYELIEKRNFREMNPNDLITISIEGVESEVPLGDIVHAEAILGVTNGYHGARIWEALRKPFDPECFVQDMDIVVEFRDKQKEALEYFFQPYYDKLDKEKVVLMELIENKTKELAELKDKLSNL